jgi:peptidoglycan/LPS O-acetylase OafA/YrhL
MTLPALTGIRFFAIFHIFLYHLWVLYDMDKPEQFATLLSGIDDLPGVARHFIANGWMSTSFFFILSGFILTYVYRREDGELAMPAKRFWLLRLTRLYPIHLLTILLTILLMMGRYLGEESNFLYLILSAVATITLTQSWYPPWVPMWSWPTWTISVLVFLYLMLPLLLRWLARLSPQQLRLALLGAPLVSLLPTVVYAFYFPLGSEPVLHWQIFVGSFPLFWLPHFFAGMVLCRFLGLSRSTPQTGEGYSRFSWGDLTVLMVLALACIPNIEEPIKYFLRHGLMMPLYMIIIADLARGRGMFARILAKPPLLFLGETGYSIFIWQNLVMVFCWVAVSVDPALGRPQFFVAVVFMVILAIASTYGIERPLARKLRRRFLN